MNNEKFTQKSLEVIQNAQAAAIKNGNPELTDLHLHLALTMDSKGMVDQVLSAMNVPIRPYQVDVERAVDNLPTQEGQAQVYPNAVFQRILLKAEDEAKALGDEYLSVEHLYLSLLGERRIPSQEILKRYGIKKEDFKAQLQKIRG